MSMFCKKTSTVQLCSVCEQQFTSSVASHQPDDCDIKSPQLTLDEWTVYAADSQISDLPLPQQVESEVCSWLRSMAQQLGMLSNPSRLYGKIVFDAMGDLFDFEIKKLDYRMLDLGFENWMNTLASGEVLLDIVNGLISKMLESNLSLQSSINWSVIPVKRMLETPPSKNAICAFLQNHERLFAQFLEPTVNVQRPSSSNSLKGHGSIAKGKRHQLASDIHQAVQLLRPIGYTLLRNNYTTREWTWKALMLEVMTLMALTGCLGQGLHRLYCCLTGESCVQQLVVPQLQTAYQMLKNSNLFVPADIRAINDLRCSFPYKRVLKQGRIEFNSQLEKEFDV